MCLTYGIVYKKYNMAINTHFNEHFSINRAAASDLFILLQFCTPYISNMAMCAIIVIPLQHYIFEQCDNIIFR